MAEKVKHRFEVKKNGVTYAAYDDEKCHYSESVLRNMRQNGYKIYKDGKLLKDEKKSKKGVVK